MKDIGNLLQCLGLYNPPGTALVASGMGAVLLEAPNIPFGLTASPLCLPQRSRVHAAFTRQTVTPFSLLGSFLERHRHHSPKPRTLQSAMDGPWGFWDGSGLFGRFPAFPAISSLLFYACLIVPLSPCSPFTLPCGPVFTCKGLLQEAQSPCSKAWALQPAQDSPGGFWDGRGIFGMLPEFPTFFHISPLPTSRSS